MLLVVSDKEPTMKDNRTVRRSFVRRLKAEQQWNTLYRLLLELGGNPSLDKAVAVDVAGVPSLRTEVPYARRRLYSGFDPAASRRTNDPATARPPAGPRADQGLDDYTPTSLER
jgi:hypothetical protein